MMQGKAKEEIPETGTFIYVDVRDVAMAHVKAMEVEGAANKRFFAVSGFFCNREVANVIRKNFPKYADVLPESAKGGDFPKEIFKIDNSNATEILGIKFKGLEESIVDLVKSLQNVGA